MNDVDLLSSVSMGRKITGVIYSDLGQAGGFMKLDWVRETLLEKLGFVPYPGTLNLRLESEKEMAAWRELNGGKEGFDITPPDPSFCLARCFLVEIEGIYRGAVIRPQVDGYPPDKLEVIAPLRLKDGLKLKDGDRITIEFKG